MKVTSEKILAAIDKTEAGRWSRFIDHIRYHSSDENGYLKLSSQYEFDGRKDTTMNWLINLRDFLEQVALEQLIDK